MKHSKELAHYEKMPDGPKIAADQLGEDLNQGKVHGFLAFDEQKAAVGMALFYMAYSTWEGQYIHLEDLYVRPQHRGQKHGKALWNAVVKLAKDKSMRRLTLNVLDWNKSAIDFYARLGATNISEKEGWLQFRLDNQTINNLA